MALPALPAPPALQRQARPRLATRAESESIEIGGPAVENSRRVVKINESKATP